MEQDIPLNLGQEGIKENFDSGDSTEVNNMNSELDFMKKMILNWGETLNDSKLSDIIICVKSEKYIYAHKLVFYTQCSNILSDIKTNDTKFQPQIKEKISWLDKDEHSVLAFLEFIYCGVIITNVSVFYDNTQLSELKSLAKLYRVNGLFTYISLRQNELKRLNNFSSINVKSINFDQALTNKSSRECNYSPKAKKRLCVEFQV